MPCTNENTVFVFQNVDLKSASHLFHVHAKKYVSLENQLKRLNLLSPFRSGSGVVGLNTQFSKEEKVISKEVISCVSCQCMNHLNNCLTILCGIRLLKNCRFPKLNRLKI